MDAEQCQTRHREQMLVVGIEELPQTSPEVCLVLPVDEETDQRVPVIQEGDVDRGARDKKKLAGNGRQCQRR